MKSGLKIGVVGASGAVGRELLSILDERQFPIKELNLFASAKSQGKSLLFKGKSHRIKALADGCFEGIQIAFFDASDAVSLEWVPKAAKAGAWVIDNASTFRMDDDIPLLVPEVNGDLLTSKLFQDPKRVFSERERIISGPNCSAAPLVMALKPIQDMCGIRRVVVSTYQSTSGAGSAAMEELSIQTVAMLNQTSVTPKVFKHQIAFNCLPHIGRFGEDGYTSEEQKIVAESKKMLNAPQMRMTATAVRVPTFSCHALSVNVECDRPFDISALREAFKGQPGLIVQDSPENSIYPIALATEEDPVEAATGKNNVYIGRIRKDPSVEFGLNFWIVSDNLRKGAALNAVQIGEILIKALHV